MTIELYEKTMLEVDSIQHGSVSCSPNEAHVISLFDLCYEHSKAIFQLHRNKLYGSAFALIRCCIESYVRALWLRCCATQQQSEAVWSKDGKWPKFGIILKNIDSYNKSSFFEHRYKPSFGKLSSLIHGSSIQTSQRLKQKKLQFEPSDEELKELLKESCFLSILANVGIAEILDNQKSIKDLNVIFDKFNKAIPADAKNRAAE
ncbi:MAG: hypothetical protein GY834_04485 [Bacteroidetes bacterium]|nr:hypothetical protein [Bacteroidota bacterium]